MSWLRHVRTYSENRDTENHLHEIRYYSDDSKINAMLVRGRRRKLPTLWDDIPVIPQRSWKRHRLHQYRSIARIF